MKKRKKKSSNNKNRKNTYVTFSLQLEKKKNVLT